MGSRKRAKGGSILALTLRKSTLLQFHQSGLGELMLMVHIR
jgi:uncharacterized membrane protein YphA (DoxX/SURF4 family)